MSPGLTGSSGAVPSWKVIYVRNTGSETQHRKLSQRIQSQGAERRLYLNIHQLLGMRATLALPNNGALSSPVDCNDNSGVLTASSSASCNATVKEGRLYFKLFGRNKSINIHST